MAGTSDPAIPPRLVIEVACARGHDVPWLASTAAIPGLVVCGMSAAQAVERVRRAAQNIAGEPVRVLVEELKDQTGRETEHVRA